MKPLILTLLALAIVGVVIWSSWGWIAVHAAPEKVPAKVRSEAAAKADDLFWRIFHDGDYEKIQNALDTLTAVYLETPEDAKTAAHIAWLHLWRISERQRVDQIPATVTDDMMLARRYFQEAVELDPSDARYLGFLAGTTMGEGNLHKDERLTRKGYFMLRDSIRAWPEFNLFTGGYILSRLPADSPHFREGLEWQWRTLDECAEDRVDRANPVFAKYMSKETKEGPKRACWNSWIAPHNFEGFFLNMGDMLVKAGDWQTAQKIYGNAKLAHEYPTWKFSSVLDDRIEHAQENVTFFRTPDETGKVRMMINSEFSCAGCHQR